MAVQKLTMRRESAGRGSELHGLHSNQSMTSMTCASPTVAVSGCKPFSISWTRLVHSETRLRSELLKLPYKGWQTVDGRLAHRRQSPVPGG